MTLDQLRALDFATVWASISPERQAEIGAMVIRQECANQVARDGGYDTTEDERGKAEAVSGEVLNALPAVIWAAIPDVLPTLYDDPYPMWQVMGRAGKGEPVPMISVRGLPRRRRPVLRGSTWFVRARGGFVELGGAVDLASRNPDALPVWEFVTLADIEAERRQRRLATPSADA